MEFELTEKSLKSAYDSLQNATNKAYFIAIAMLVAVMAGQWLKPTQQLADQLPQVNLEATIPLTFGEWRIIDKNRMPQLVSPEVQQRLDTTYDQMLSRTYTDSKGHQIMLLIAYGRLQNNELKTHRQEICYKSQGFEIQNFQDKTFYINNRHFTGMRFYGKSVDRQEAVTYWFTLDNKVVYSHFERLFEQVLYSFKNLVPDGFLVRISSVSNSPDEEFALQERFANELFAAMNRQDTDRIIGILN